MNNNLNQEVIFKANYRIIKQIKFQLILKNLINCKMKNNNQNKRLAKLNKKKLNYKRS